MKPILQALVLADKVYEDRLTGKKVIAGTFNHLFFGQAPKAMKAEDGHVVQRVETIQRSGNPTLYLNLTEVRGTVPLEIRYVSLRDNRVLFRVKFGVEGNNPLDSCEVVLPLPELPRPHEGRFAIELLYEDELIGSHRVTVTQIKSDTEGEES